MPDTIVAYGPPPLTQHAADAALDAIDFVAAVVRGVDIIDVTDVVRPLWREHLASWYPHLPPETRQWYADAPLMLATFRTQWALLDPPRRAAIARQWALVLPHMLWMLDPVMVRAQLVQIEMQHHTAAKLAALRLDAFPPPAARSEHAPARPASDAATTPGNDAMARLADMAVNSASETARFVDISTSMTTATLQMARAIAGR